jgi:hypothetical protein
MISLFKYEYAMQMLRWNMKLEVRNNGQNKIAEQRYNFTAF